MKLRTSRATVNIAIGDASVTAQALTHNDLVRIREKHTRTVGRGASRRDVSNENEINFEMFDFMVTGWKGIEDAKGKELKCTTENKRLVYEFDQAFAADVISRVSEIVSERGDLETKN